MLRAPALVVWVMWAALAGGLVGLVGRYGSDVPSWDEWDLVPALTGNQPVTAEWLWSQHNEHRVPLPRLGLLVVNGFGVDFRIGQMLNAGTLAGVAALLILAARAGRGRTSYTDAFFPLVLLHPRHAVNVLWGWQFQFVLSAALACVVLGALVRAPKPGRGTLLVAGAALLALPLCGANGVALVPALALWFGWVAFVSGRAGERGRAFATLAVALAGLALVVVYFAGFEPVPNYALAADRGAILEEAVRFLAGGLGPTFRALWPATGVATALALLATLALLVGTIRRNPGERARALGLLAFLAALGSLALGLGLGGRYGFEPRYVTLAAPAWCAVYLAWALLPPPAWLPRALAPAALAAVAALALQPNVASGLQHARDLRSHLAAFEQDVAQGVPPYRLIARHGRYLHPHHELLSDYLPMLRAAGVGVFAELRDDPPFEVVPVELAPLALEQCTLEGNVLRANGSLPQLVLALPPVARVAGVRLRCAHASAAGGLPCIALEWREDSGPRTYMFSPTGDRATWARNSWTRRDDPALTLTCWLDAPVAELRLHPDYKPCELRIDELALLVAP